MVSDQRQRAAPPEVDLTGSASFEDFVGAEAPRIFAALRLIAGNRAEAEDLMLDAFMQVWDRWDRVRASDDAPAEIFRTAMSLYQRRLGSEEPVRRRKAAPRFDPIAAREARDEMLVALDHLTPAERLSVVLMDLFGYPSKDVGELMGIRASQVRTLASHGRTELRRRLGESHGDVRTRLRQAHDDVVPPPDVMGSLVGRRQRLARRQRERRRKTASLIIGVVVLVIGAGVVQREMARPSSDPLPAGNPIPQILDGARLAPGPHELSLAGLQITFSIPEGWRGTDRGVVDSDLGADAPGGAALSFWTVTNVYTDPCRWRESAARPPVGASVNDLVQALARQHRHPSGQRLKIDVDGHDGTEIRLTVPDNIDIDTCSNDEFHTWQSLEGDRYQQGPGQIDQLFIVSVEGTRLVIDASYFPDTSQQVRSALFDMVRSVHFM